MKPIFRRTLNYGGILAVATLIAALAGAAMAIRAATFPVPTDNNPVALSGLTYAGRGGVSELTEARREIVSKEGEDPLRVKWILTARNTTPQVRQVKVAVYLLSHKGKRIAAARANAALRPVEEKREIVLDMKVSKAKWEKAEKAQIQIDFLIPM